MDDGVTVSRDCVDIFVPFVQSFYSGRLFGSFLIRFVQCGEDFSAFSEKFFVSQCICLFLIGKNPWISELSYFSDDLLSPYIFMASFVQID